MDSKDVRGEDSGHRVIVSNRESVTVKGVLNVDSFDDQELVLDTELGTLTIGGEELHVRELNLESGNLFLEGLINSLTYSTATKGKKGKGTGLWDRIFR
ncbi:MAG: sporulation protein YabP [Bacillota bacterium]